MSLTLKQYRANAGWSVTRMAKEAGLSRDAVEKAEKGTPIRAETAYRIAQALSRKLNEKVLVSDIEGISII